MRKKEIQENADVSATIEHVGVMSGKRKFLRFTWIFALCLSVAGFLLLLLFFEKTTWIDDEGLLYEPLFWVIPTSYFFLCTGLILALWDKGILTLWDKISTAQEK